MDQTRRPRNLIPPVVNEILYPDMDEKSGEKAPIGIGPLVQAIAKTYQWAGLYGTDHPVLAKRVGELHAALLSRLPHEPEGQLLLGIARDKFLYLNQFIGEKQDQVSRLTESLYLRQVATVGFTSDVTPDGLLELFRYLHESKDDEAVASPEQFLRDRGIRGISLSPYNYRELLSRKIVDPDATGAPTGNREEDLWRLLLTAEFSDRGDERKIMEELADTPVLLEAILRRAKEAENREDAPDREKRPVSGEVLRRVVGRLSGFVRELPPDRKKRVLSSIGSGVAGPGGGEEGSVLDMLIARSLTDGHTNEEFLDLVATLVSLEGKGGERLRKSFSILAGERNREDSLLPRIGERIRESRKIKDYYAQKTWEAVERLILARGEEKYIKDDHHRFLEDLSTIRKPYLERVGRKTDDDLGVLKAFGEEEGRRRTLLVLLDLLREENREEDFQDILEDFRKTIPNLISLKDYSTLVAVMLGLDSILATTRPQWQDAIREILAVTDFGAIGELCITTGIDEEDAGRIRDLLGKFGEAAAKPLLDRLLQEPEAGRRRALIRLLTSLGPSIVPEMVSRLSHPKWYFVRNLCLILGDIGDRQAVAGLLQTTAHPDHRVKREAIVAIGKMAAPEAVPGLGKILVEESFFSSKKEDQTRIDAASALYRIGGTEAIAFLHRGKKSRRQAVHAHCDGLLRNVMEVG